MGHIIWYSNAITMNFKKLKNNSIPLCNVFQGIVSNENGWEVQSIRFVFRTLDNGLKLIKKI